MQLRNCEDLAAKLAAISKMKRMRITTGYRPRQANLFDRLQTPGERPVRYASAYVLQYDGGSDDSTYEGLAISADGITVYDLGVPALGVRKARIGPKRNIRGYRIRREITITALRDAAAAPTSVTWFEYASRAYVRAALRLGIKPDPSVEALEMTTFVAVRDISPAPIVLATIDRDDRDDRDDRSIDDDAETDARDEFDHAPDATCRVADDAITVFDDLVDDGSHAPGSAD